MADKKITDNDHPRPTGSGGGTEARTAKAMPSPHRLNVIRISSMANHPVARDRWARG
jgi:hypothetical protein